MSSFLTFTSVFPRPRSVARLWLIERCNQFNQRVRPQEYRLVYCRPTRSTRTIKLLVNRAIGIEGVQDAEEPHVEQVLRSS